MVHVYSEHLKQRVIDIYFGRPRTKYPYAYVRKSLQKEEIKLGRKTIRDIILRYNKTHSLQPRHRFGRQPKTMNPTVLQEVESYMRLNDEATNAEIKNHLANIGIYISITSIRRVKKFLGWTYQTPGYCQLIRHINKTKRVDWANRNLLENFDNVIWSDETSVWLEKHKRRNYHKKGESKKPKPRAKYPVKVHVWAGISRKGATGACIFEGTMNAELYIQILENTLVPFIKRKYGPNHRFMQDNDPKHTSRKAKNYFAENGINWWETPPESPDINPIEMVWHELKEYIRGICKPSTKEELIQGISAFWQSVTPKKCNKYINHLHQVVPMIIEVNGSSSGF